MPLPDYCQDLIFDKSEDQVMAWVDCVEKISEPGNFGVIGDTGTGKTVVAILLALKLRVPTLILVPQKMLAHQHQQRCYNVITAQLPEAPTTMVLTGEISPQERASLWQKNALIFFATPQTVLRDMRSGRLSLEFLRRFRIIAFDEMHRSRGKYAYVPIAKQAFANGSKIIGLSASPGGTRQQIEELKQTLGLDKFIELKMQMPAKIEDYREVEIDETLKQVDSIFREMLAEVAQELSELGYDVFPSEILTISALGQIKKLLDQTPEDERDDAYYLASSLHAQYYKLRHLYAALISEAPAAFTTSLDKMRKQTAKASRIILSEPRIKSIIQLISDEYQHPKVLAFLGLLSFLKDKNKKALVFVYTKATAQYLAEILNTQGIQAAILHGGRGKQKLQDELIQRLQCGELDVIVATSVAEEGLHVPEVDLVIHYSMPQTEVARIQRSGRTGRKYAGRVVYLCINHPLDRVRYFVTRAKERTMRKTIQQEVAPRKLPPRRNKKYKEEIAKLTLPLFSSR